MRHFVDICGVVDNVFGVVDNVFGVIDNVFGVVENVFGVVDDLARAKTGFPLRAKGRLCSPYKPRVTLYESEIGLAKEEGVVRLRELMQG